MRGFVKYCLLYILTIQVSAQQLDSIRLERPERAMYFNILGDGSLASMGFEKSFFEHENFFFNTNIGMGYNVEWSFCFFGDCGGPDRYLTVTNHLTGNVGKNRSYFEFGLGSTLYASAADIIYMPYPIIGLRVNPKLDKNRIFRLSAHFPVSGEMASYFPFSPLGFTFGFAF